MINFYWEYKNFGLPFSGGYAEQKEILIQVIKELSKIDNIYNS